MTMRNLTLSEMERLAYIEGRTEEAAMVADLMAAQSDLDTLSDAAAIQDLEDEIDQLTDKLSALEDRLAECDCDEGKATP